MLKKKKAQIFIEFFLIFIVAMIAFLIFLMVGVRYVDSLKERHDMGVMESILDDFKMKSLIASSSSSDFNTVIIFPEEINGNTYDIHLENSVLILSMAYGNKVRTVSKLLPPIEGTVQKGCNLLRKTPNNIEVAPVTC